MLSVASSGARIGSRSRNGHEPEVVAASLQRELDDPVVRGVTHHTVGHWSRRRSGSYPPSLPRTAASPFFIQFPLRGEVLAVVAVARDYHLGPQLWRGLLSMAVTDRPGQYFDHKQNTRAGVPCPGPRILPSRYGMLTMDASVASVTLVSVPAPPSRESLPSTLSWEWSESPPSSPKSSSAPVPPRTLSLPNPPFNSSLPIQP